LAITLMAAALAGGSATALRAQVGAASADTATLTVGSPAPDFTLPWADKNQVGPADKPFTLKQAAGTPVVLAFYPKDFTGGCTAEMTTFTEQFAELFGPKVIVMGISVDSLTTHQSFATSLGMPFKLLSDPDQTVARRYQSAGDGGYDERTVYVIDRAGKIAYRNMDFGAVDPQAYEDLKAAVRRVRD
jgi:peroxiredoxin